MQFKESGAKRDSAKNYKNCENTPLISEKCTPISHVSVMPLHLSPGIGLQFINIVQNAAVSLDIEIRETNGLTSDGIIESYNKQHLFETEIKNTKMEVDEMNKQLSTLQKQKVDIEIEHPEHFVKENGKLKDHNLNAKATRKRINLISKEIKQLEEKGKTFNKIVSIKTAELKQIDQFIDNIKGPFKTKFDDLMDSLKLKRQVYHSNALLGNDIEKLYGKSYWNNLVKFSNVFTPITIQLSDGTSKMFSSHMLKQKLFTLLLKFSQIYELVMLSRTLCQHEVSLLTVRCYSLGNWFPVSFHMENLSRKFHVLHYHVLEKATNFFTVGLYTENISESIHPVVNKLKRRYASITDLKMQLSICKDQWLSSKHFLVSCTSNRRYRS